MHARQATYRAASGIQLDLAECAIPTWNHDLQRSAIQLLAAEYSRQESYSDAFNRRLTAPSHSSSRHAWNRPPCDPSV